MMNPLEYKPELYDWYIKHKVEPPKFDTHGTEEDIRKKLKKLECTNWHMEGPGMLVCDTEMGPLINMLSPDIIMTGLDDSGLPILTRIGA